MNTCRLAFPLDRPARALAAAALLVCIALPATAQPAAVPVSDPAAIVVQTKPGAMVSRIASAHRPAGASIDQMLLAILQANPDAFMAGNINLLKKGAALTMPAAAEVLATPAADARRQIQQQNADFEKHGYRLVQMAAASAASSGASSAASPDASATAPALMAGAASDPQASADAVASPQAVTAATANTASAASQAADAAPPAVAEPITAANATDGASAPALSASDVASATAAAAAVSAHAESASAPGAAAPVPATDSGINPLTWLAAGAAVLLAIVAWLMLRIRRMREEERLAAEAAAAQPRAAAEALSRVLNVDHQTAESSSTAQAPAATETPGTADALTAAPASAATQPEASTAEIDGLTLDLSALEEASTNAPAIQPRTFDFSSIDLELEDESDTTTSPEALLARLELAREFLAISDFDGARTLAEEVADKADEELEAQARQLLDAIDAAEKQ